MSSDRENGFDSTSSRTRKRMLPSVAEVARELSRRTAADAASILTIARKICAEELVRVKEGQESVPVDVLVERARALLEKESQPMAGAVAFEPPPPAPVTSPEPSAPIPEGADPFGETMGKLDLRWEGDAVEPPHGPDEGVPPEPRPTPFETSFPLPDRPTGSEPDAERKSDSLPPFAFTLEEPFVPETAEAPAPSPSRIPLQPPPVRRSKLPFFLVIAGLIVAAGGAAWFFLSRPSKPAGPPPSLAVKRKPKPTVPAQSAGPAGEPSSFQPSTSQPPVQGAAGLPSTGSAPSAAARPAPTAPAPPALPATPTWIKQSGGPAPPTKVSAMSVAPEPVPVEPKAKPAPAAPAAPAPSTVNVVKPPAERAVAPVQARKGERTAPSATQVQVRAGTLVTPDWTGAPVYVVHFSSFVEKARTERHAAVLAKQMGLPARAVQVDLGDKGLWYRAIVGEFATAEEALSLRNQLLEKGTPGVGLVYRMTPKK